MALFDFLKKKKEEDLGGLGPDFGPEPAFPGAGGEMQGMGQMPPGGMPGLPPMGGMQGMGQMPGMPPGGMFGPGPEMQGMGQMPRFYANGWADGRTNATDGAYAANDSYINFFSTAAAAGLWRTTSGLWWRGSTCSC